MSGPWEKYAAAPSASAPSDAGPWGAYGASTTAPKETPVTGTQASPLEYMDPRGIPEAALAMGTGMVGQALGGLYGLVGAAAPGPAGQGADTAQRIAEALTYSPKTKSGQTLMKGAELLSYPVHAAADFAGDQGAKVSPALGAAAKTGVEAIPLALGIRTARAPKAKLTSAEQKVADARDAGYVMTPEEMGAGVIPRTAASLSGEPRLAKLNTRKNTETATLKAKEELGIRPDAPLDLETLGQIRKDAGTAYDAARGIGEVAIDAQYLAELDALAAKYKSAATEFPGAKKLTQLQIQEIDDVIAMLRKDDPAIAAAQAQGIKLPASARPAAAFDASGAIDMMGALREGADGAFRSGKNALGKVMRGGAEALEAQIERHLSGWDPKAAVQNTPNTAVLDAFRAARERIAKTYAVEKALVGDEVNMQSLGRQVKQRKPLTGGLKEAGDFARESERSSQKPTNMPTGATFADLGLAAVNGIRTGGGSLLMDLATVGARPAVRHILSSRMGQWAMDPRTNLSGPALETAAVTSAQPPPQKQKR